MELIEYRRRFENRFARARNSGDPADMDDVYREYQMLLEALVGAGLDQLSVNEELLRSQSTLKTERSFFHEFYDLVPQAYLVTDAQGVIDDVNQTAGELFGVEPSALLAKPLDSFFSSEDMRELRRSMGQDAPGEVVEARLLRSQGRSADVVAYMTRMHPQPTEPARVLWVLVDVTERKRSQRELRRSNERFQRVFAVSPTGIALFNSASRRLEINYALGRLLGIQPGVLPEKEFLELVHEDDRAQVTEMLSGLFAGSQPPDSTDIRLLPFDGRELWVVVGIALLNPANGGEDPLAILTVTDRTTEKSTAMLRLELQHRLLDRVEAERTHLARELHDNPLQDLYGVLYRLNHLAEKDKDGSASELLVEAQATVQQVIDKLRRLAGELRPPSLLRFGLDKALQAYVDSVASLQPDLDFQLNYPADLPDLQPTVALALYRIAQQCVMNTLRHAQANCLTIEFAIVEQDLRLSVSDDGVGFETPPSMLNLLRAEHYGLAGISERADSMRGRLAIRSKPGEGTRVDVFVPVQSAFVG